MQSTRWQNNKDLAIYICNTAPTREERGTPSLAPYYHTSRVHLLFWALWIWDVDSAAGLDGHGMTGMLMQIPLSNTGTILFGEAIRHPSPVLYPYLVYFLLHNTWCVDADNYIRYRSSPVACAEDEEHRPMIRQYWVNGWKWWKSENEKWNMKKRKKPGLTDTAQL